jgi:hypothetical protein
MRLLDSAESRHDFHRLHLFFRVDSIRAGHNGPPLMGFAAPPHRYLSPVSTPGHTQARFHRPESTTLRSRSALAVSHHLDGLLRMGLCQFVAPDFRQGFVAPAPSASTEVIASGRLATLTLKRTYSRRFARIAAETITWPGPSSNRTPRRPETCSYIPPLLKGVVAEPKTFDRSALPS